VITAVVALERTLVKLTERHQGVERLIESEPVLLVRDGVILGEALHLEDLSQGEVFVGLREKGVEFLGEVRRAYLEPSGHISVFMEKSPGSLGVSILPTEDGPG
jgi:uncharacterized membrane protein YcaP (DUF421 family)